MRCKMVCEIRFEDGAGGGPLHSHPHRQVSYVASGEFEYTVVDEIPASVEYCSAAHMD